MSLTTHPLSIEVLRAAAIPIKRSLHDYDQLLQLIGNARFVLLGEATHGTHEFYQTRALLTERLVLEKGFRAVAIEADWPDAHRVNRYVRGEGNDHQAREALSEFKRFPAWMWRNLEFLSFIHWLRVHNDQLPPRDKIGIYGLDLYSLHRSMEAVVAYLDRIDPSAAKRARHRYACFDHFGTDPQDYALATSAGHAKSCEREVIAQLLDLRRSAAAYLSRDGMAAEDDLFFAEQNARLAKNAEEYYRAMFSGRVLTWNLRDQHMTDTVVALDSHLSRLCAKPKMVIWEHNSHLGNASATEM